MITMLRLILLLIVLFFTESYALSNYFPEVENGGYPVTESYDVQLPSESTFDELSNSPMLRALGDGEGEDDLENPGGSDSGGGINDPPLPISDPDWPMVLFILLLATGYGIYSRKRIKSKM